MERDTAAIHLSALLISVSIFAIFSYTPYLAKRLGASNFQIGLVSTVYFAASTLGGVMWGVLSDTMNDRKLLPVLSGISLSAALLLLSSATSPTDVIVGRALVGLTLPAYVSPMLALISERSRSEKRGRKISWFNSTRSLGSMIGLIIAGYTVIYAPISLLFQCFSILTATSIVPVLLIPIHTASLRLPKTDQIAKAITDRFSLLIEESPAAFKKNGLLYLYIALILRLICIYGIASFLPVHIVENLGFSPDFLGFFYAFGVGLTILAMPAAGWCSDKLGRRPTVILAFALSSVAPIFYGFSNNILTLGVGRVAHSISYSFILTGASAFVGDVADKKQHVTFMGLISVCFGIGGVIGPLTMGVLLDYFAYPIMGAIMFISCFSGLILVSWKVEESLVTEASKARY